MYRTDQSWNLIIERRQAIDTANYGDWTAFSWNAPSVFSRNKPSAANNIPHMFQPDVLRFGLVGILGYLQGPGLPSVTTKNAPGACVDRNIRAL